MKLIAFNNQLQILPTETNSQGQGEGEEQEMDQDQNSEESNGQGQGEEDETDEKGESEEADGSESSDEEGDEETQGQSGGDESSDETEETQGDAGDKSEESSESSDGESDGDDGEGNEGETSESDDSNADSDGSEDAGSDKEGDTENYDDTGDLGGDNTIDLRDYDRNTEEMMGENEAGGSEFIDKEDKEQRQAMADMLEELLTQMENAEEGDTDLKGHNEAFSEHFEKGDGDLLPNEMYWRPYAPDLDTVKVARNGSAEVARKYLRAVKKESSALTTRLRSKFLQARSKKAIHGTRQGKFSDRRIVASSVELRSGRRPTRPNWQMEQKQDCTLAVSLVIDQSGSMSGNNQKYATMGAIAIAEPLDKLGAPIMVCGPRNGQGYDPEEEEYEEIQTSVRGYYKCDTPKFHRACPVHIDVFKDWNESMVSCLSRFSTITASGGTPLSDGIQYAMQELSDRTERHRVIIVLTDGAANCPDVVNRQIRLAKEAGIHVIGVGIGDWCDCVTTQFPENHIQIPNVSELPKQLLGVLDNIMFPKKSRKARMDGRIG